MLEILHKRRDDEEGFTLIELMVVVLIIGILIAIAVPTFLGAQKKAKDRAAQSNARQALSSGKTYYTDKSTYAAPAASTIEAELKVIEPSLGFTAAASTGPNEIMVVSDASNIVYGVKSKNDTCYYIKDSVAAAGGTFFLKVAAGGLDCTAALGTVFPAANTNAETAGW